MLIDFVGESILRQDLTGLTGKGIVAGDIEQALNLVTIFYEIAKLMQEQPDTKKKSDD
jgi:hypothetical protein